MWKSLTFRLFILSILSLLVSAGSFAYMVYSIGQDGLALKDNLQALSDRSALEQEYNALQEVLAETAAEREQLSQFVLEGEEGAVDFLSTIDQIANDLSITLNTQLLAVEEVEDEVLDDLKVVFEIEGNERAVMRFIQLVELLPYKSRIDDLSFVRKPETASEPASVKGNISIKLGIVSE